MNIRHGGGRMHGVAHDRSKRRSELRVTRTASILRQVLKRPYRLI